MASRVPNRAALIDAWASEGAFGFVRAGHRRLGFPASRAEEIAAASGISLVLESAHPSGRI